MDQLSTHELPIPKHWTDVTPEWMTMAIAAHHPGATVSSVELLLRDDGTNRRARFGLNYAKGSGPETVFAKAESDVPGNREAHARNGNMFNESKLFRSGVPLPLEHPLVHAAVYDEPGRDYVIVMEDLVARGADCRNVTRPLTVDQVACGVRALARLHSEYWNKVDKHPALDWVQPFLPTAGWQAPMKAGVRKGMEKVKHALADSVTKLTGDDLIPLWNRYVGTLAQGPQSLLHGDPHVGNTYVLPDGNVGFLDFQVVRRGNWSLDVGYFIQSALAEEDRRRSEADLIEVYRQDLEVPADTRPNSEEAWLSYRASVAHGLVIWLVTASADQSVQVHSPEICLGMVQHYAAAFVDLDTAAALDAMGA